MSERYDPNYFGQALQSFSSAMASPYAQIIHQKMAAQDEARKRFWKLEDTAARGYEVDAQGNAHYVDPKIFMAAQARLTPEMIGYTTDARGNMYGNADITSGGIHPLRATQLNSNNVMAHYDNWNKMTRAQQLQYNQAQNGNPFNAYMTNLLNKQNVSTNTPLDPTYDESIFKRLGGMPIPPLKTGARP